MKTKLIDEVRKAREDIAQDVNYDFHTLFMQIYHEQETHETVNLKEGHERPTFTKPLQVAEPPPKYGS
jgi:hypothetical protein